MHSTCDMIIQHIYGAIDIYAFKLFSVILYQHTGNANCHYFSWSPLFLIQESHFAQIFFFFFNVENCLKAICKDNSWIPLKRGAIAG